MSSRTGGLKTDEWPTAKNPRSRADTKSVEAAKPRSAPQSAVAAKAFDVLPISLWGELDLKGDGVL